MTSSPRFKTHVFISYASLDNRPLPNEQAGWVTTFHDALTVFLGERLGEEPSIWRDIELKENQPITDTLLSKLDEVAVMVSVLTPRYKNSAWCMKELERFWDVAERTGGVTFENRSRLFKIVKTPIPREETPAVLSDMRGYEFFSTKDGSIREFRMAFGGEEAQQFMLKVSDIAYQIADLLKSLPGDSEQSALAGNQAEDARPKVTVYLAETTSDLQSEHDNVRRDLLERGFRVLPEAPLPLDGEAFKDAVRAAVAQSKLSIHMIGSYYGESPVGEHRSFVHLQNEIAASRDDDPDFDRLIWVRPGLDTKDFSHRRFVHEITNSPGEAEFLETSLENLKTIIQDKLATEAKTGATPTDREGPPLVYLVYNEVDRESGRRIDDALFGAGYEVLTPSHEGDEAHLIEEHKHNLLSCDAVLVYWDGAPEFWVRATLQNIQKSAGYGRSAPFLARAVFVSGGTTEKKERFRTQDTIVMKSFGDVTGQSLAPFFDAIGRSGREERHG